MIFRRRNDGFNSFSLAEFLTRPFRAVGQWLGDMFSSSDQLHTERSAWASILSVLTFPFRFLYGIASFMVQSWASSRSLPFFLLGIPAVATLGLFLTGIWASNFLKSRRAVGVSQFNYVVSQRDEPNHPEYAEVFAEKLVDLKPNDQQYKFELALTRARCGDMQSAIDIMEFLAPEDRVGFPPAHVWLAERYSQPPFANEDPEVRDRQVQNHLDLALQVEPENVAALIDKALMEELEARKFEKSNVQYQEHLRSALGYLKQVTDQDIRTIQHLVPIPRYVKILIDLDQPAEARQYLTQTMEHILPLARQNADITEIWQMLISCAIQLKDFELANKIIFEGMQLAKTDKVRNSLQQLSSQVVITEADSSNDLSDLKQFRKRLNLLSQAIADNPRDGGIYQRLIEYIAAESNPDFSEAWLRDSIVGCPNPAVVHLLLGFLEINNGNIAKGKKHWRIAEQQFPQTPLVVTFLLDTAIKIKPDEFKNLMDLVTLAIEMFPDQTVLYYSRGVYLKQQGRLQDALADFEHAAELMPRLITVRQQLVNSFTELGQPQRAHEHQKQIDEILTEFDDEQRQLILSSLKKIK